MGGGSGTEGFFGGLLSGLGQGLLDRDAANYAKKLQDAKDRKALLTTILGDPNATWGQKATALQAFVPKPEQQGPVSKLLHRGKKQQSQQPDPIEQLVQSYRALDAKSNPPAQGQASPAPVQAQTTPASTPPLPQVGHPASATEPQPSTPPLPFPASPAALKTQQESRARIGEYQTESGITTQENVKQATEMVKAKLSQIDSLVKTGQLTPEEGQQARVEAITGHQLTRTTGTTLTGEEGQAVEDLLKQTNPATGKPYTRDEAVKVVKATTTKESVEQQELNAYLARNPKKTALDFLTMKSNLSGSTVPLTPAAIEMLARQTRETGQIPSISWGKAGANLKAQIANKAAADAPTSDLATNAANYKSLTASLKQTQEQATKLNAFETVADKNLRLMLSKAGPISDTGSPWLNMTIRQLQLRGAGNPDVAAFVSAWRVASNEVSRVLNNFGGGGVLSDSARHETEQILNPNSTLAQLKASSNVLETDMRNRRAGFNEAIQATQGAISAIGQQMSPTGPVPSVSGDVSVQIPGHPPGTIPRSRLKDFQKRYPNAQVLQ